MKENGNIEFLDVKNENLVEKNATFEEAKNIINYVKSNKLMNATIVTPFVNQQNLINKMLKEENITTINCGTIHSLQGAEQDTIILSTAISGKTSPQTYNWLKNNVEILNVGVTRAKKKLVITGDYEAICKLSDKKDDLYNLVYYAINDGNVIIQPNESYRIEIGKSNGSKNEDEFYKTIHQFCSTQQFYEVKRNVTFKQMFYNDPILSKEGKEFDFVIYKKNINFLEPKIVIELNGLEHFSDKKRQQSDMRKKQICESRGIKYIMVDNSFIKSYELLKTLIIGTKRDTDLEKSIFDIEIENK